ncbi:helix-turn-helix domain-containing protein [Mycobacteroides abscessus]|uniref:helix-turn-helix domain-containing protein n=1 Tax=Mycobacteroides abscessus TaxID=36809 RepID=UPI0018E473D3
MGFADRLIMLRESKKLRQEDIANIIGVARSTYGMYEQGKREPDHKTLCKIADFYGVQTDFLLKGVNDKVDINNLKESESIHFFDMEGLDEEAIEEIERQIEYLRWKASQRKKK